MFCVSYAVAKLCNGIFFPQKNIWTIRKWKLQGYCIEYASYCKMCKKVCWLLCTWYKHDNNILFLLKSALSPQLITEQCCIDILHHDYSKQLVYYSLHLTKRIQSLKIWWWKQVTMTMVAVSALSVRLCFLSYWMQSPMLTHIPFPLLSNMFIALR